MGKRQRLVVLRRSVKPFPCGKHYRFNSYLSHCLETESLVVGKAQGSAQECITEFRMRTVYR